MFGVSVFSSNAKDLGLFLEVYFPETFICVVQVARRAG